MTGILTELALANAARSKIWDPEGKLTPLFFATELGGECGELLNIVKKLEREKLELRGSRATLQDLDNEAADVIICVMLLLFSYGRAHAAEANLRKKFNETSDKLDLPIRLEVKL